MKENENIKPQTVIQTDTFQDVLGRRIARRSFLKGALLTTPFLIIGPNSLRKHLADAAEDDGLNFKPIKLDNQDRLLVAEGYRADVLIRWGDPVFRDSPAFNPLSQSKLSQEHQFGYNCDFVSYLPLPYGSNNATKHCSGSITNTRTKGLCSRRMTSRTPHGLRSMSLSPPTAPVSSKFAEAREMTGKWSTPRHATAALPVKLKWKLPGRRPVTAS